MSSRGWAQGYSTSAQDTERAIEVISAVPLAAAVGWSVRGHQWTTHPRRLRTAVVSPSKTWDIEVMRSVREVDGLSGRILVRMRHIRRLDVDLLGELNDSEPASEETTIRVTARCERIPSAVPGRTLNRTAT
ncbi:MAG: hypothetical protein R2789_09580 [Microthrixaceae bacterium]